SSGVKKGCGHYVIVSTGERIHLDCGSKTCGRSKMHACRNPRTCPCNKYYGPDDETILRTEKEWCPECTAYYTRIGRMPPR
ncbi:hypothetical protein FISHEDRAFT_39531, partial [Fistulina hepatica ATCC 64428]